jgi:uncharacterized membrane-anchored protein YhcB (DUF1043 family)
MTNTMFVLLAVGLLAVGVLIGSGLHTRAINRRYRRVAQLVQELHELEEDLERSGHLVHQDR